MLPVVDTVTFEEFYRCWKEGEMQCREIRLPTTRDPTECVLKISDMVKCSLGMGRVGLTQRR